MAANLEEQMPMSFYPKGGLIFILGGPPAGKHCKAILNSGRPVQVQPKATAADPNSALVELSQKASRSVRRAATAAIAAGKRKGVATATAKDSEAKQEVVHVFKREGDHGADLITLLSNQKGIIEEDIENMDAARRSFDREDALYTRLNKVSDELHDAMDEQATKLRRLAAL
jgi:hypothetical protein